MSKIPESIALVDFFHMLTVHFKAQASSSGPNDAGQNTLNDLAAIRSATAHVVVCVDSPPYWRKEVFPGYKAGREREPEFAAIVRWTLERVEADGFNIARAPGEEADDVMATLAHEYAAQGCGDVRIVGADKDALQCVTDSVRCFVAKGRGEFEIRGPEYVKERFGVDPHQFPIFLGIMGDTSDKIPGIKGIGEKGATKLIQAYKNPEGMAKACVAQIEASKMDGKLPAFWKNYAAGMADLPKWIKLTTLNVDAQTELHPLKYLEPLPVRKLVETPDFSDDDDIERDAIQGEGMGPEDFGGSDDPDWEAIAKATAERELAALAAALPVDKAIVMEPQQDPAERRAAMAVETEKVMPRIGKDPNADKVLADAAAERAQKVAAANTAAPKTPERVAATAAQIAEGNAAEHTRPKESTTGQAAPSQPATSPSTADSQGAAAAHAEVVPKTQGPQAERMAMVVVPPPSWELATQPRSPSEMAIFAARMWNSRFYSSHGNADGTFAVIALGRELGLGAAAAVEGFHIVQGRPFAKAVMLKALAEKDPNCEWILITSADAKQATIKTQHKKAGLLEYTYTIERAAAAGYLTGKNADNWKTKTQEMLEARATSKAVRRWYPGATFGMHSIEEAGDD